MTQKTFANLLKAVIILAFLCVAVVYALYVPAAAAEGRASFPELESLWVPALIFVELTAVPVIAALVLSWFIARDIGRDQSFTRVNAHRMKTISFLALADVFYFLVGIGVFWTLGIASGPLMIFVMLICSAGVIVAVCAGALSHLILKAAVMREEQDLTV